MNVPTSRAKRLQQTEIATVWGVLDNNIFEKFWNILPKTS